MYFITFIDDFSKNSWTYFLKQKTDACENFKIFKVYVKKTKWAYNQNLENRQGY